MISIKLIQLEQKRLSVLIPIFAVAAGVLAGVLLLSFDNPLKIVAGVVALAVAVAIVWRLEYGLLLLVFSTYVNFFSVASLHGAPPLGKLLIAVIALGILFHAIFRGEYPSGWFRPVLFLFAYGVAGLFSFSYALDLKSTQKAIMDFAESATLAVVVILLLQNGAFLRRVIWALIFAGFIMSSLSIFQYITGSWGNNFGGFAQAEIRHLAGDEGGYRISGPIGDANFYAQILIVLIPLSLERLWREKNIVFRFVAGAALILITVAIILTFSRGAFLALCVTVGFTVLWIRPRIKHYLMAFILALPLLFVVPTTYVERMKTMVELIPGMGRGIHADSAFRGRASEYRAAWLMFQDHPFLGVGLGNYPVHYQRYSNLIGLDFRLQNRSAHSLYLQIAAETGLMGLSVFALILWYTIRGLRAAQRLFLAAEKTEAASLTMAFTIALFGYLTAALFLHTAYPDFLWILIGIGLALPIAAENEFFIKQTRAVRS